MQCGSCGTSILATFKYALAKNECPACGGPIMGEEYLALIEDIKNTIRGEAAVREDTANQIAMSLVAKYDISMKGAVATTGSNVLPRKLANTDVPNISTTRRVEHKVAPPSTMKQIMQQNQNAGQSAVHSAINVDAPEGITDEERDRIFEDAIRERYNMVDQIQADSLVNGAFNNAEESSQLTESSPFSEGNPNPILEQERMARLAKQQNAMQGGGDGVFRRSS